MGNLYKVGAQQGAPCDRCASARRARTQGHQKNSAFGQQLYTAFTPPPADAVLSPGVEHRLSLALIHMQVASPLCARLRQPVCRKCYGLAECNGEAYAHTHTPVRVQACTQTKHGHTQCANRSLTITRLLQQGSGHVDGLTGAASEPDRTASAIQRSRCKCSQQHSKWSRSNHSRRTAPKDPRKSHPESWQEEPLWKSSLRS